MAGGQHNIQFGISYKIDKTGLNDLKNQLNEIANMSATQIKINNPNLNANEILSVMTKARNAVEQIRPALDKAFDTTTGIVNLQKLQTSLKKLNLSEIQQRMAAVGPAGEEAFLKISQAALTTNVRLKETSHFMDKMGQTFLNTVKWSISSKVINSFTGSIQQAWGYVKHLDTSLNDIRIVTEKSAEEMDKFAVKANDAAKALGSSTTEYTEAALIYYQQGLGDQEAQARAETTLKAANVTGQTGRQVSEELTAVWNGYKVTAEETELYVDKLAAVAASTASDLEELSTGMSKVASAANNMGVDVDQLNAQLATIISVTRQAPETAGTALKTIYARIEDLKLGGSDEDGIKLGDVSGGLASMGIEIKDAQGNLRDLGEVIEEIGWKWDSWTESQKSAIAQLIAGKRQYNNLLALFDNWDMYNDALETSQNSLGTLQKQQDIYMESTEAHLQKLDTEWEDLYDSLIDQHDMNGIIDGLTNILDLITNIIDAVGGGKTLLLGLIGILGTKFSKQIADMFTPLLTNMQNVEKNAKILESLLNNIKIQESKGVLTGNAAKEMTSLQKEMSKYWHLMSEQEINASQENIREIGEWESKKERITKAKDALEKYIETAQKNQAQKGGLTQAETKALTSDNLYTQGSSANNQSIKFFEDNITQLSNVQKSFDNATKAAKDFNSVLSTGQEPSKKSFDSLNLKIVKAEENIEVLQKLANKGLIPQDVVTNAQKSIDGLKQRFDLLKDQFNSLQTARKTIKSLEAEAEQLNKIIHNSKSDPGDVVKAVQRRYEILNKIIPNLETKIQNIQNRLQTGGKGTRFTDQLIKDLPIINGQIDKTSNEYKEFIETLKKANITEEEANQLIEQHRLALNQDELALKARTEAVSKMIGGVSSLAFGLSSLSNLPDIISDENLSTFQKFLQITTGLTMGVPMVKTGLVKIGEGMMTLTGETTMAAAAETFFTRELTKSTVAASANKKSVIGLGSALSTLWKIISVNPFVKFVTIAFAATEAIGSFVTKVKQWNAEVDASDAENRLNLAQDDVDKATEYADKIKEVVETYKSLKEEYANNLPALRNEIYDVIKAHGLQVDTIEILTASYKELDSIMKKIETDSANAQNEAQKTLIEAKKSNLIAQAEKTSSEKASVFKDYVLGSAGNLEISTAIAEETGLNIMDSFGDVDWDAFYNATEEQQAQVESILSYYEHWNSRATDALNIIRDNKASFRDIKNEEDSYNKSIADSIYQELTSDQEIKTVEDFDNIKEQLAERLTTELQITKDEALKLAEEELNQQENLININAGIELSEQLKGTELGKQKDLAEQIAGLSQSDFQFLSDNLDLASAYESLDEFFDRYKDLQKYLQKKSNALKISTTFENAKKDQFKQEDIDNLFSEPQFAEDFGKTKEEFEAEPFEMQTADMVAYYAQMEQAERDYQMLKEEGNKKDAEEQKAATQQQLEDLDKIKDRIKRTYQVDDTAFEEGYQKVISNTLNEGYSGAIANAYSQGYEDISESDVSNVLDKYSEGIKKLTSEEEALMVGMEQSTGKTRDQLVQLRQSQKAYESFITSTENLGYEEKSLSKIQDSLVGSIADLDNQIKGSEDSIEDMAQEWNNVGEGLENMKKWTSSSIDNLQSAYSSLTSIIKDYNSEGTISIDNLQTILSMDTAYLAALQIQNGQMSLNYDMLKQIALARLDEAEAEAYVQFIKELNNETDQKAYDLTTQGIAATEQYGITAVESANKAKGAKKGWEEYWQAAFNKKGETITTSDQAAADAYYNKVQAIDQVRKQIINGNFSKTLEKTSSSTSKSSKDTAEYLEREVDLYREINEELDNVESTLSRIQKIDEHSWGISAKKALEQENELLEKQSELLEKKAATYESDLATRRKALEDQGVTFTDDGSAMTNSETVLNNLYKEYNSMVDKYNAMSKDDQDNYKVTLEAKKDTIENIENAMDDYESAYNDYNSVLDEILDNHYELIENAVNQFNADIDVRLELDEAREDWEDFWSEVMEDVEDDDFVGKFNQNFRKLDIFTGVTSGADTSKIADLTQHVGETTSEVNKQIASAATGGDASIFGDDSALSKETLTNYRDQLMEAVRSAKSAIDDMMDNYLSELSSAKDKIDEQVDGWNRIGDVISHDVEMTKLLYGDKAYEDLNYHFEQQYDNNLKLVETQKMSMDYWGRKVKEEEALMNSYEEGSEQYKMHEKAYKEASKNYKDAIADLNTTVENSIKSLQEWRENQVASITDTLDKALSGGMGLENMEKQWDLVLEMQDTYLDNVERAIEMESLQFDFNDVLNNMDLREDKQKEFLKFMDEENEKLKEKNKLTQYDIDEVKARLEIKKAEMALEEAQRNKSNMRLRRDTQGNYTYQYTANEGDVEDAEKNVLTARKEWYELVKKRNMDLSKEVIDIRKRIVEEEKILAEAQANHDVEAERAAQERIALLKQQGVALMGETEKAKQDFFTGTANIFKDVENNNVLPTWNTTVQDMIDKWSNGGEESFVGAVTTATTNLENVQTEFGTKTAEILKTAGLNYDSFRTGHVDPTKTALDNLQGSNDELGISLDDVDKNLQDMNSDLDKAIEGYNGLKEAAKKAIEEANKSLETLAKTAIESVEKIKTAVQAAQTAPSLAGSGSNKAQNQADNSTYDPTYAPVEKTYPYEAITDPSGAPNSYAIRPFGTKDKNNYLAIGTKEYLKKLGYNSGNVKGLYGLTFKSGGYTGNWNQGMPGTDNGRLAVLHQKELVLNEADTANLLKAVSLIRTLVGVANSADFNRIANNVVGSSNISAQLGSHISSGALQSIASNVTNNSNVSNSKDITINADFSGVRSADEIYQAFMELQNYGMQESYSTAPHANRSY